MDEDYKSPFTRPFKAKKICGPEDQKQDVFTVRLNLEEREVLNRLKYLLNIEEDSKALKFGAQIGLNVLHNAFTDKIIKYISDKKRQ